MIFEQITRYSLQEVLQIPASRRIIILYPQLSYRNLFFAPFLNAHQPLTYYRVSRDHLPLSEFLQEWAAHIGVNSQHRALRLLADSDPAAAAQTFAALLNQFARKPILLLLDEFDRVQHDDKLVLFFRALASQLTENIRIVINGRVLWSDPWADLVQDGYAAILAPRFRRTDLRFAVDQDARPHLEIYGFGKGTAFVNGKELDNWDGILPRNLFFYFADQRTLNRDQIFSTFWPTLRTKEATNVFHVTKRKVTECLAALIGDQSVELMTFMNGYYSISEEFAIHYDVADFEHYANLAAMVSEDQDRIRYSEMAASLYGGAFLDGVEMPWVRDRREKLRRLYVDVLARLARWQHAHGDKQGAYRYYVQALREAPQREDLHRALMRLYVEMQRPEDARAQYQFLCDYLRSTYSMDPSPDTRNLYATLMES
jgi:two-component SAPR family response regulator